jgi:hypothetical protein
VSSQTVTVRVRPDRALTLADENGSSTLHVAGRELELPADDAKQLVKQGFVERA